MAEIILILIIILICLTVKYPSISLILFLTASFFKTVLMLRFGFFRVFDYTVLCGFLVLLAMFWSFLRSGGKISEVFTLPVFIFLLLVFILLLGAMYTTAPNYGWEKSTRFAVLGFIAFAAPFFFALEFKMVKHIVILLFVTGILIGIGTIVAPRAGVVAQSETWRGAFLEADPLDTGARIASGVLIAISFCIMAHTSKIVKTLSLVIIPVLVMGIIQTGSRGAFIGLGFCVLIVLFLFRKQASKIWVFIIILTVITGTAMLLIKMPEEQKKRTMAIFQGSYSIEEFTFSRMDMYKWVLNNTSTAFIVGHGTGAFAVDWGGSDVKAYPHNIILELLYENGIISVILFIIFMFLVIRRWFITKKLAGICQLGPDVEGIVNIIGVLMLFTLFQSMKSSDIDGNRFMFFSCGLILAAFRCIKNEHYNQLQHESANYKSEYDSEMLQEQEIEDS